MPVEPHRDGASAQMKIVPVIVALIALGGCYDFGSLAHRFSPDLASVDAEVQTSGPDRAFEDLGVDADLGSVACVPEGSAALCGASTCGELTDSCGQTVSCGVCPGTCATSDGTAGQCACAGGRIGVDQLVIDVHDGDEGVYHCYAQHSVPDGGMNGAFPCQGLFHEAGRDNAFYVYPADLGPRSGLTALYHCDTNKSRHFLSTSPTCAGFGADVITNVGLLGYIATSPSCGAVALHHLLENDADYDRVYLTSPAEIAAIETSPCPYDGGRAYVEQGILGYVWLTQN